MNNFQPIATIDQTHDVVLIDAEGRVSLCHGGRDPAVIRAAIGQLTARLLALPQDQHREMPVKHSFCDGMYMRELFIPAGTLLVGKIHRKSCINIVAAGDISILTEHGMQRVQAGFTGVSDAGIQKVGFAHEDTLFVNVFRTDETDVEKIEREVACESHQLMGDTP